MIKPKPLTIYHGALITISLAILWHRGGVVFTKDAAVLDVAIFLAAMALLLIPLFKEVSLGGVTLKKEIEKTKEEISDKINELRMSMVNSVAVSPTFNVQLQEIVHREVNRTQEEALRLMADIDLQLLPLWEAEHSSVPSDFSSRKLALIKKNVQDLEDRLATAPEDQQIHFAWVLRSLYWMWLESSRAHFASSLPYQETRQYIENKLKILSKLGRGF